MGDHELEHNDVPIKISNVTIYDETIQETHQETHQVTHQVTHQETHLQYIDPNVQDPARIDPSSNSSDVDTPANTDTNTRLRLLD